MSKINKEKCEQYLEWFGQGIYRLCCVQSGSRQDAEDAYQETFLTLLQSDVHFADDHHVKAWLIRTAINRCRTLKFSAWFRKRADLDEHLASTDLYASGEVFESIRALPEKYRTVIHLFYCEDMKTLEIAKLLGRAEGTVSSQLTRGRALLRKKLKDEYDYD